MENYAYSSSYPDSGDSSPRSREIEYETAVAVAAWDGPPPPNAARVKLICSYGGRIQPRSHDNQLSYVGGDTRILAVDRSIRYPSIIGKLSALCGSDDVILKYQLPGEDLDALISVTNDEDLEHMMIEYDRLHRTGSKPVPRLRLFLFAAMGKTSQDRPCFTDPPRPVVSVAAKDGPDYLFGLEETNFLPAEAAVKDPAIEKAGVEVAAARSEAETVVPSAELQMHLQELQRLQIADKQQQQQQQQQVTLNQRNGSDENLTRVYPPADYYAPPPVQEKTPSAPASATAYWQEHHRSVVPAARLASFVGGDGNFYLIPVNAGGFPANAAPGPAYYTTMQRVVPAPVPAYDNTASVYTAVPPQKAKMPAAYDNGVRSQAAVEASGGYAAPSSGPYDNGAGYAAYDSAGRPLYYAGTSPTYQTVSNVSNVAISAESKALKPAQVS